MYVKGLWPCCGSKVAGCAVIGREPTRCKSPRQCLLLDLAMAPPAEAHRRDETQQLGECAQSVLAHSQARDRMRAASPKVSFSAALQPGMPKTRMVPFQRATEKVRGFLALPRDPNRHRAIIVVHEWWGLNKWVKEQAANLAAKALVQTFGINETNAREHCANSGGENCIPDCRRPIVFDS